MAQIFLSQTQHLQPPSAPAPQRLCSWPWKFHIQTPTLTRSASHRSSGFAVTTTDLFIGTNQHHNHKAAHRRAEAQLANSLLCLHSAPPRHQRAALLWGRLLHVPNMPVALTGAGAAPCRSASLLQLALRSAFSKRKCRLVAIAGKALPKHANQSVKGRRVE